ncbi:putative Hybrid PKS-NRPS biosynthetic cluster [Verticillium nonalfalfae]|uniref:Putative Hybrid PKS-NRPS biosynthetic cluster n=1 Tax=Verticillium nonalfalfae TaxID=1051616 RepID=A0A3M9Y9A8_9PEZI|nr:putative Hybrid PKS-NRPS biosynthetic cluster [Verticillium nonalfalfae]RNJ56851.1 putative Hybrid PKS-NRPS biosynthetic cluster [Verticillium nonalfalfae]
MELPGRQASMNEPIAIIGTACRLPGSASSPSKLWELIKSPQEIPRPVTADRLNLSNFYSPDGESHGRTDVRKQPYLLNEDIRRFDASFFRINPKEAAGMDPQQRILLETVYEALEAAGLPLGSVEGSQTSVHVGVMTDDYAMIQARDIDSMGSHAATGLSRCILSNRVSYAFDLRGPSMTVDTACSSSLVALHLAVQSLRKGEASQAVVGGTSLLLDPHWFVAESSLHMLSSDSRSRMWDVEANGYARGEGCAVVILKPLNKAIQDGDHIESVIRETGVNSDGRTNGMTMPCPIAQATLIQETYQNAGLNSVTDRCQYFECHGTGTQAGDPVEARAISSAFFPSTTLDQEDSAKADAIPLYCGSIKTIVGHLEGCAGLAGLLRASLAVQHGVIPPNMHFNELNPSVKPFYTNLCVPTSPLKWPDTHGQPRRASVNSFGFGGTNAHTIIESYVTPAETLPSSKQTAAVKSVARQEIDGFGLVDHLRINPALDLDALSSVLHSNRSALTYKIVVPAMASREKLLESLEEHVKLASSVQTRILGIFTGQGAQAAQMGRQLVQYCTIFRQSIQKCEADLKSLPEGPTWSLMEELTAEEKVSRLSEAVISQPLCTALQIALVDLLKTVGIEFAAVVGHSSGEIGAAYAAGLLSGRHAMGIAYYRGQVAHLAKGPGGKAGEPRFKGRVSVAAGNAPSSVTLSGDLDAIEEIKGVLTAKKIQARQLRVDTAYHSHHMLECAEAYLSHLQQLKVQIRKPAEDNACVWFSSVRNSTDMVTHHVHQKGLEDQYWVDNMVQPVLFSEAVQFAIQSLPARFAIALEVGPHPALKGPVSQTIKSLSMPPVPYVGCLEREKGGIESMSSALGTIWSYLGPSAIDFGAWRESFNLPRQRIPLKGLPTYAWDHDQVYWLESRLSHNMRVGGQPPHTLLGRQREDTPYEKTWRNFFHLKEMPWVTGHTFQGQVLFPGAGYFSIALEASKAFVQGRPIKLLEVRDMNIPKALVIGEDEGVEVVFTMRSKTLHTTVSDGSSLEAEFVAYSCSDGRVLVGIRRAFINPNQNYEDEPGSTNIEIEAMMVTANAAIVEVDISLCAKKINETQSCGIQIDGLILKAIAEPQPSEDRNLFVKTIWDADSAYGLAVTSPTPADEADPPTVIDACERITLFYMQNLIRKLSAKDLESATWYHQELFRYIHTTLSTIRDKKHAILREEWLDDDRETILKLIDEHPESVDIEMLVAVGENLPSVVRKESGMMEHMLNNDLLSRLYKESRGLAACNQQVANLMRRISHKHPRMRILEIGAGTGGTTLSILSAIGEAYTSYTCTDISASFFNGLSEKLPEAHTSKVNFKVFDAERPPGAQGFAEGSYDIVIAANVLHATRKLSETVRNARALLRPGGHLIAIEVTGGMIRETGLMGGLEGWWLGTGEGRKMGPGIDPREWDSILEENGFSGVDYLDNPFFAEPPTPERLDRLQGMLGVAHNILWVTCGRMLDDPYANMMVGIGRALVVELPHVNMHYLDFECPEAWNADVLVRHVLRMAFTLASSTATQEMLWSEEPEVLVKGSEILVPRIVPDHVANESLNAKRRKMSKTVTTERITIDSSNIASQQPQLVTGDSLSVPENHTAVDVKLSLALQIGAEKPCFLCFGRVQSSGQLAYVGEVLVLSAIDSSTVVAPTESLLECCDVQAINAESLVGTASALIALQVVRSVPQHGTTLVFGATVDMAHAISAVAAGTGHNILFVAVDSVDEGKREDWIVLHPRASARVAQRQIPKDTSLVINMSKDNLETTVPFLPLSCVIQTFDPSSLLHEPSKEVAAALGKAHDTYRSLAREEASEPSAKMVVNIAEAPRQLLANRDRLSLVLDWERHGPVSAVVRPLEASSLFSTDKTYFLVGMAGELGQSLCRFMIRGGARHIVLASRNPAQDPHWLKELRSYGTNVRIVKMDVTDRAQVHKTVSMLRRTMPKIGGVANAALVFEAGIFVNFSADNVTRQLKPKVDGSLHLDEAFASDNLEFFLTFGSLATVCGNPGQAMYHAGNMFMSSLVEKRRRRGQAASILNFGLLVDVGYVARMDRADGTNIEGTLRSLLLTPLSEAELHHLVLQGIISGRPGSASGEVIMGMPPYKDDGTAVARPPWVEKAFFSHMIHAPISTSAASHGSPQASTSNTLHHLRSSLNRAGNITEITQGVRELMFKKIELMIKVPRDSIDASSPLADLGLDSLHGIDIRKWLLEDLKVNIPLLKILGPDAIEKTLGHHEAYQTCFFASSGSAQVKQNVTSDAKLRRLRHIASTTEQAAGHAQEAFKDVANTEYQLASGETFRAVLVTHGPEKHTLIFGFHLMASDALSFSIFLRDLDRAYQMRPLAASTGSYLDFSCRQHDDIEAHRLDDSIRYWRQHLDPIPDTLPLLPIAQASSRKASRAHQNHIVERKVEVAMVKKVKTASQACGATSMQFYLAVMQVLIARLGNVDDLCIGIADSGRSHTTDFSDSIGHFANILPVRFKIDSVQSFKELVNQTSHSVLRAFDNSQVPFDLLLEKLGIERSPAYTPLFQVAFNYRVGDILQRSIGDCALSMEQYVDIKTPYDLVINVTQAGSQGHLVECITNGRLYSIAATEFITETFVGLVESLAKDQFIKVRDCKLFNNEQVEGAVTLGRGPTIKHTWPKTLSERFQDVVSSFPNSIAIKDDNESLTYNLLTSRVGLYASSLVNAGAEPGSRVAVLCVPSIDIYATMLAALHIGAVYVPLDVNLPIARLRSMMDACKPDVLVFHAETDEAAKECSRGGRTRTLDLSELQEHTPRSDNPPPLASTSATQESFLLFTSGSTGTPKGIRLGQRGIMNYAASKSAVLGLGQVRVLQQTSCGFDMAIAQAFNAFANGGTLVIAPTEARGDPTMISKIMLDEAIEFTLATPSEYLMLTAYAADTLQRCTSWRFACSGGEAVSVRLVNSVRRLELPELNFMDCYGPTEVSCAVTFRTIQLGTGGADSTDERNGLEDSPASNNVGKAISNTSIYILSEDGKTALPFGMPGEICIGGSGVARGYLDSRLSQDKFVPNPFATPDDRAQGQDVMYHTGDKGYLLADGSLAFLGRINGGNTVIKLRGLRIDLDEVAGAILAAAPKDCIADAIVMARGEPQFLVAYVVCAQGRSIDHEQLDLLLRDLALPRYMVPSMIVPLDHLPTSTNGKVDRATLNTLPLPDQKTRKNDKAALTVPEGELRALWQTVLGEAAGAAAIGPYSDFFTVGGSSLLLVRLQNILRERMGVLLPLQDLYQATTLRKMAAAMHQERGQLTEETIDWKLETAIPDSVLENANGQPSSPPPKSHDRQVLLTGAGSFLGSEILTQLLKNDDVAKIHCVAVSDDEREKLSSQDDGSGRMIIYAGSLMSPTLGLSGTERALLRTAIDQIIHAAVQGHCMNNYTSVKDALYISTQTLVRLALPRQVPFHFISAPRVVLLSGQHEAKPVSMAAHLPPTDGSQGVTASKWASECFLEKIAQERDLPVVVHRHCALIGERAPADDVMNSVVRFSVLTRKVPNVPGAQGFFDFKDVVTVASEIEGEAPAATGAVCYRHHSGDVRVPFSELAKRLSEVYGGEFETVEPSEWLQAAGEFGMGEMLVIHLKANMESGKPMVFPYLGV